MSAVWYTETAVLFVWAERQYRIFYSQWQTWILDTTEVYGRRNQRWRTGGHAMPSTGAARIKCHWTAHRKSKTHLDRKSKHKKNTPISINTCQYRCIHLYSMSTHLCMPIAKTGWSPSGDAALQQATIKRSSITEANLRFLLALSLCRPFCKAAFT